MEPRSSLPWRVFRMACSAVREAIAGSAWQTMGQLVKYAIRRLLRENRRGRTQQTRRIPPILENLAANSVLS